MQKLQDSVFSVLKTTNLSPAVFSFLQLDEDFTDKTPLGGILKDTKHGWLAIGPKFCVVDLRTGLKVAARTFGTPLSNLNTSITSVIELPKALTGNSIQLVISLQNYDSGMICVFHVNGSQLLHCIHTEVVITELAICDRIPDGPFTCFDGVVMAGTKTGEIFAYDLNRAYLIQALRDLSQGYEHLIRTEANPANLSFLKYKAIHSIESHRQLALKNDNHIALLLNEDSIVDGQYIFHNPDGTIRMKAKRDHIRVTVLQYIPQLGSLAVGYNFGAFQIWNMATLELEFTSQVNVECLPVTHFGFQEPCDDPRAFCYLWVVFSVTDKFEEEEFPLAVMYSLTYQGKRMLSDTKCLYQDFTSATIRFQLELGIIDNIPLVGGKCVSCHTYSVNSTLGAEGEDSMLNICQIVWECWGENAHSSSQYGMLLFDLDQWYKDQMPATCNLESNAFMSMTSCTELSVGGCVTLDVRLDPASVAVYSHATRLEEHFYPNSLQYNCICLNTSGASVLNTIGIQRQIISSIDEVGPTALLNPSRLYNACVSAGLTPLYTDNFNRSFNQEDERQFLLSVALEARLSRFLKRCAHNWATGTHTAAGCTLPFLVDWCWKRALDLKENAKELTAPLFVSSALPDRNVVRCLEHCVQQLTQLTGLLDAVLTKCCNLIVPDALSEIEEKYKGIGTVSLYFQVVQWFLRVGLLPERHDSYDALSYPAQQLYNKYNKRRLKLNRLQDNAPTNPEDANKPCSLLYIDQLIEKEFGGDRIREMWIKGGSECDGLYPAPSLYSLLRLYLLCDVAEEHKHSLVLYLLVDYSMIYDDVRYEAVIRRLMQFPTMFGLSNTAIKATQAFWHLDHRDFDFALDQLQCLTGNTLSEWQHHVVLSTLLAQNKTQAALQYLHVRKPAPLSATRTQGDGARSSLRMNDHDKLEDWQPCCNLYLARGLVFEALDVIRICVQNAHSVDDKMQILNFFFKGCRNTGNLAKLLQVTLLPLEEEVLVKYLEDCNDPNASDILVMYYLQNSRYLEAERYNNKLKHRKPRNKDVSTSYESLFDIMDRESARDAIVEVVCSSLPAITNTVAKEALDIKNIDHVIIPKPMSVYVTAKSPKNTCTYKSSFIQDTIENASETWMNRPKMRRGIKRALNIEETPFICTPKLSRTRSILSSSQENIEATTPKRARLELSATPKTPKAAGSCKLSAQMSALLDMPDIQSPDCKLYLERQGAETPHSILKIRREALDVASSPVDSRYLNDSEDELLETASNHTHYSDSTKHLRFTIPTPIDFGSSPLQECSSENERETPISTVKEKEVDMSAESFTTTASHPIEETHPLESPPKKVATEESVHIKKTLKDSVRARRSLSVSMNSSLSEDPNTSVESIADIPVTLINPRYSGERRTRNYEHSATETKDTIVESAREIENEAPKTPRGRRSIRAVTGHSTPVAIDRNRSVTPERQDSPLLLRSNVSRSRSRTPELSPRSSPLAPIPEQPRQELDCEPHPLKTTLSVPRQLRSRSRTPDRKEKNVAESSKLEVISESPTKSGSELILSTSLKPSTRSRSRTPERNEKGIGEFNKLEAITEVPTHTDVTNSSPNKPSTRSRSRTPEKLMSPSIEHSARVKRSLSRLVLEANTFAKNKQVTKMDVDTESTRQASIECTPMKTIKQTPSLMDVTLSPIVNKSELQSFTDSAMSDSIDTDVTESFVETDLKPLPDFTRVQGAGIEKSVLHSYESSRVEITESSGSVREEKITSHRSTILMKSLPAFTLNSTDFDRSVLKSYQSSIAEESSIQEDSAKSDLNASKPLGALLRMSQADVRKSVLNSASTSVAETSKQDCSSLITNDSDIDMQDNDKCAEDTEIVIQKEKEKIVEIEREIHEIEGQKSDEENESSDDDENVQNEESASESESSNEDSSSEDDSHDEEEIISVKDSDESNSSSGNLQIDEAESKEKDNHDDESSQERQEPVEIVIEVKESGEVHEGTTDPLTEAQCSILTDDNSGVELDKSDIHLNYSDGSEKSGDKQNDAKKDNHELGRIDETINMEIVEKGSSTEGETTSSKQAVSNRIDSIAVSKDIKQAESVTVVSIQEDKQSKKIDNPETEPLNIVEQQKEEPEVTKQGDNQVAVSKNSGVSEENIVQEQLPQESREISDKETAEKEEEKPVQYRKRTKSTSSNKSVDQVIDTEIRTPVTRKRTQSNASTKSVEVEENTPEATTTPRRRAKTPTSADVRKIITRRVSREMAEKDDSKLLDESKEEVLTPRRRSARSRSKNIDDNESVASETSVTSGRSRVSEDGDKQLKKGKKTVLTSKPELAVIPEVIAEEKPESSEIINEYSNARRLTRHQKSVLESWLEVSKSPRRRPSTASRTSRASRSSRAPDSDEEEDREPSPAFDVQPIDRISLLNKTEFEGAPDIEELQTNISPESLASDARKQVRRLARAASETKTTPKAARINRRTSVDVVGSPVSSVSTGDESVSRGRRASFNRACEALHTPKGRRTSTDVKAKGETSSPVESTVSEVEVGSTPGRRTRRTPSTASVNSESGKRSKKPPLDEDKDKKK